MHLAVITVVYNKYENLVDLFASLDRQTDANFHLYIADLSSQPQEVKLPRYASLIKGPNGGYASGLNLGLREAMAADYSQFVFINDDITVAPDFVAQASKSISEHPGALIGGKIYYYPGSEFHTDRYTQADLGKVLWYAGGSIDWAHAQTTHRGVDEVDQGQYNQVEETGFVTGCLMAFDSQLINSYGMLDESYFMYYEDTDWNAHIVAKGGKLIYDPSIIIWHKNSQSTGGSGSDFHRKYQRKNLLRFGLRHAPLRTKLHLLKNHILGLTSSRY